MSFSPSRLTCIIWLKLYLERDGSFIIHFLLHFASFSWYFLFHFSVNHESYTSTSYKFLFSEASFVFVFYNAFHLYFFHHVLFACSSNNIFLLHIRFNSLGLLLFLFYILSLYGFPKMSSSTIFLPSLHLLHHLPPLITSCAKIRRLITPHFYVTISWY